MLHFFWILQDRLGKGEFDKSKTRVVHFKRNPEAVAVEKAQQGRCSTLQAENTALKGQLQKLEGQSAAAAAGSIDAAVQEAQITVLQHQVLARTLRLLAQYEQGCFG